MKKIRRLQTQGEGPRMLALEPQMNLTHGLTPKRLRGILELADQGDILEQHLLFADMEDRCEHLAAEMGKRKRALLTLDWEILPGRANDARAARIAAAVREQFDAVNGFEDLLMDLADGIGHGFSACEIEWDYRYGLHLPAAFHFRPQSWFQVLREDRNQLRLRNGKPDGEELWPFGWIVHTHPCRSGSGSTRPAAGRKIGGRCTTPCGRSGRMRRASSRKAWISCLKPPRPLRRIWRVR